MRAALVIAARSLRQRVRDRSAILFGIIVPLGLAAAFSLLIPRGTTFHVSYAVHDADGGPVAAALVDEVLAGLVESGVADITKMSTEDAAIAALSDGRTAAAILIPAGFSAAVERGAATEVRIVALPEAPLAAQIAGSVVGAFASEIGAIQLAVAATAGGPPGTALPPLDPADVAAYLEQPSPMAVSEAALERRQADSSTFYAAGMAIMFLFFATIYGPIGLLGERRIGTLARLLAAPIRPASIVLGSAIAGFVLGIVSMTTLIVATTVLLGASWGPPLLVAALAMAAVVAAMGLSMLICTLARTEDQAGGWNAILAITLAVLGGAMVPLSQAPEILHQLSRITPHAWFLEAIDNLAAPSVALADIAPALVVLCGFGAVAGAIGLVRARSSLVAR
jgi:ABC-2 type transport system permease protein